MEVLNESLLADTLKVPCTYKGIPDTLIFDLKSHTIQLTKVGTTLQIKELIKIEMIEIEQETECSFIFCSPIAEKRCSWFGWMLFNPTYTIESRELIFLNLDIDKKNLSTFYEAIKAVKCERFLPKNKGVLLVFLNPHGGNGSALKVWESVQFILQNSNFVIKVVETTYYRHCYNYLKAANLSKISGIISVSGDGLIHEIINALKQFHFPNDPI